MIPKEQIAARAYSIALSSMRNSGAMGYSAPYAGSMMAQLTEMVAKAIEMAIAETLNNLYTSEEFDEI